MPEGRGEIVNIIKEIDTTGEQRLWQHVIWSAFVEATYQGNGAQNLSEKAKSKKWIEDCGKDFRQVCDFAGMDPDFLSDALKAGKVSPELLRAKEKSE